MKRSVLVASGAGAIATAALLAYVITRKAPTPGPAPRSTGVVANAVPGSVVPSPLVVGLQLVAQIPASSPDSVMPRTRITKLDYAPRTGRTFVVDLRGTLYELRGGAPSAYLDLAKARPRFIHEPGLATGFGSFAFHPDFASNGLLYTTHTEPAGSAKADFGYDDSIKVTLQWVLSEWKAADPRAATFSGSSRELLRVNMVSGIHGVQEIAFNPRSQPGAADYGLLYVGIGDGGSVENGFPFLAHDTRRVWGTIVRIDPAGRNSSNGKYGIPADNPFVAAGGGSALGEIFAYGFRNPHRISWTSTGEIIAPNIGQNHVEALHLIRAGHDYGWPIREGRFALDSHGNLNEIHPLPADDSLAGVTYPVAEYEHDGQVAAISGGFEYQGSAVPELAGKYLFGDIPTGRLFYVNMADLSPRARAPIYRWSVALDGVQRTLADLCAWQRVDLHFGRDEHGELYILTKADGKIYRMVSATSKDAAH